MSGKGAPPGEAGEDTLPEDFDDEGYDHDEIEASLNDALSDLERMLQRRGEPDSRSAQEAEAYSIPMLDEVVIPGPGVNEIQHREPRRTHAHAPDAGAGDEADLRRRLATRLASEIEVIVQDRLEQAMEKACEEVRERVRNHMDIILPEIVEEMLQFRHRDHD